MKEHIQKFIDDEGGLTTVEYAVAGGLIAAALVTAFTGLRTAIITKLDQIAAALA